MDPWLGTVERERTADLAVAGGELKPLVESLSRLNYGPCTGWTAQALALNGELPHVPWAAARPTVTNPASCAPSMM